MVTGKLARFSVPIILSFTFYQANLFINTVVFGNMADQSFLVAYGLAMTCITLTAEVLAFGFSFCLETVVAQAYGAREYYMCGIYFNRQIFINSMVFLCLGFTIPFAEEFTASVLN